MGDFDFSADTLGGFLERVASDAPAPGGGGAAAVSAALAAGLVAMAARFSRQNLNDPERLIEEADRLRAEALQLATHDAEAYQAVLAAYRLPKDTPGRSAEIIAALEQAADTPLAIAKVGATLASLGSQLAAGGNPNLHGDAVIAVILADAATRAAACLVELNVTLGELDGTWLDDLVGHLGAAADAVGLVTTPS